MEEGPVAYPTGSPPNFDSSRTRTAAADSAMGKTRHLNGTCGQLDSPSPSWFATEAANGNRLTPAYKQSGGPSGSIIAPYPSLPRLPAYLPARSGSSTRASP